MSTTVLQTRVGNNNLTFIYVYDLPYNIRK